ncbi:hypothetical protein DFH28DRAFT_886252, partial [Melampsora americana]
EVPIINPWRTKANGRIIRHVPLVLYCDDLSGNKSKRWNKHLAFYFTLAGLPPKLSNQEYNCHFVTTSNTAGALELAEPVVDELNNLITDGFTAYDHQENSEVLVMTTVLCHLGDSPMHAEVTNTMNPTTSLTPCRVCQLKVQSLMKKRSPEYVCDFLGVDKDGNRASLPARDWSSTIQGTKDLWELAQLPGTITDFDTQSSELGLRDTLNTTFVKLVQDLHRDTTVSNQRTSEFCRELNAQFGERLFNPFLRLKGFDGHQNTPVEVLHVILLGVSKYLLRHQMQSTSTKEKNEVWGRWRSFDTSGLNIPRIQPKTMIQHFLSLTGKEFRVVLQAAPFIFFECKMSQEERETWTALSHLAPYIFQTEISDMKSYLEQLEKLIYIFLKCIVQLTAQWCNKPKFHMLTHLCEGIKRYGPACLFGTENFEAYNGNTRESSIKSNHISPGRDIANSFNNHRIMRAFGAGSKIYNHEEKTYIQAGMKVQQIFQNNMLFQKALGYNALWNQESIIKIGRPLRSQPSNPKEMIPDHIRAGFTAEDWRQLDSITLKNNQRVASDVFVSLKHAASGRRLARVIRIWGVGGCVLKQTKVEATQCSLGQVNGFYGMREVHNTKTVLWVNPLDIEGILNIQHNCHDSQCKVEKCRPIVIERRISNHTDFEIVHEPTSKFILNSGSFYSAELHRFWAKLSFNEVTPEEWKRAIECGINNWKSSARKRNEVKDRKREKEKDKFLASQSGEIPEKRRKPRNEPSQSEVQSPMESAGTVAGPSRYTFINVQFP